MSKTNTGSEEIPMDKVHTLDQLTSRFQSIKDGLPELVKNSKDHYGKLGITSKEKRQIVLVISSDKTSLGVLDFGGASKSDLDRWKVWSIRPSNKEFLGDIEAGHGNGGKAFMARGCKRISTICGYFDGKINKFVFRNNDPKLLYSPRPVGDFIDKPDAEYFSVLNSELGSAGLTFRDLPERARTVFEESRSFTFVYLEDVKDLTAVRDIRLLNRVIAAIPDNLVNHSQTAQSIETCEVWMMVGKKIMGPLKIEELDPYPGFEIPLEFEVPETLIDPESEESVLIGKNNFNKLTLRTCRKNLRLTNRLEGRNVIKIKNQRNTIAIWSVAEIAPLVQSAFIFGELKCSALKEEHQAGSERIQLVDIPLTRALKHWVSTKIKMLAERIYKVQSASTPSEDAEATSEAIDHLRKLMEKFLQQEISVGQDEGNTGGKKKIGKKPRPPRPQFGARIDKILLEKEGIVLTAAKGTTIPLVVKCYEIRDQKELPVIHYASLNICVDNPQLLVDAGRNSVAALDKGEVNLYLETPDGKVRSNEIKVKIVGISNLSIKVPETILKQGQFIKLEISPLTDDGSFVEGMIYETHIEEQDLGKINRLGGFTAGGLEGEANILIKWGQLESQVTECSISIGKEKVERHTEEAGGSKIPYILLCGQTAPNREDLPLEQKTHTGGEEYPTIIDSEPLWEGIIWLNHKSKEAIKIRKGGQPGRVALSLRSRIFQTFLVLKFFEILKRLKLSEDLGTQSATITQVKYLLGSAETQTADYLDEAFKFIETLLSIEGLDDE